MSTRQVTARIIVLTALFSIFPGIAEPCPPPPCSRDCYEWNETYEECLYQCRYIVEHCCTDVAEDYCCGDDEECWDGTCRNCCSDGYGPYTAEYCGCTSAGGDGWNECSVKHIYHTCACSTECNNTNKVAWAVGTTYSDREIEIGRRCNGASYCAVTNVKGKHATGDSPCWVAYIGCD